MSIHRPFVTTFALGIVGCMSVAGASASEPETRGLLDGLRAKWVELQGDVQRAPAVTSDVTVTSDDDPPIGCPGCPTIPLPHTPITVPAVGWSWTRDGCDTGTFTVDVDGVAVQVLIQYGPTNLPLVRADKQPGDVETFTLNAMKGHLGHLFVNGEMHERIDCR